ncbi:MAG TPA: sporulation protein YunB [Ruminococcaceae bacterium]|jgi:sporulation protein YunB|nr:sporulation protein YunB [Oscillospiraceae bacterium]HBG55134.1 sporulation protein YunB [Oscillospiraceae bacterium]HBQ45686.1 sporulation protein YunB [Oscillospiraceae bacterium]HBT90620.1 sporulation protein YunB [Oscillospiraceae bacterium]HCB91085.1 sporulation protein YunB [Oscillospiraceae bacterium]
MRRRRRGGRGRAVLALILLACFLVLFNLRVKPVVESITANEAKVKSVGIINGAVLQELEQNGVTYDSLVSVGRGEDGSVLSITTDMVSMNRLKAKIISAIQDRMDREGAETEGIPIGTLFGGHIFHGRGPKVYLKLTLSGNVTADFKSTFESAGINQTKHQICLQIRASVYSFLPGFDTTTDVNTNVVVAETVIVGSVPEVVANLK